jgi:hypothetical protein
MFVPDSPFLPSVIVSLIGPNQKLQKKWSAVKMAIAVYFF